MSYVSKDAAEDRFAFALLGEEVDVIQRVLRRYLDLRDGRVEMPDWFRGHLL